ncbi:coiled-coil domain-containing protein 82 isoform X1 [Phoenix dactylifera]|uniref:Coiled-coil domain-containing protein 82 isoform X1 n=1 Tax=Phoenix dactylifera TaxID=42345 RepID=A0A8B7MWG5_PHODC|nr:coiled-coil domain-containing protein 82 isoform X1 [Phoenix dactylifera]
MEGEEEAKKTKEEVEAEISRAMRARVRDFKEQADSLTLEGVRRALEKDLRMKTLSLDVHKRFIKQCLEEHFYGADDEDASKSSGKVRTELAQTVKEEKSGQPEDLQSTIEQKNNSSSPAEETEGSALFGKKSTDRETENSQRDSDLNEDTIKEAIKKKASYFRANSEHITLQQVRRLLEEDLKLAKKTLDAYKSFISKELDMVLQSPEILKPANGVKKKPKKASPNVDERKLSKVSKKAHRKSDSSDGNNILSEDYEVDEEIRPKKRTVEKIKATSKNPKRQKKSTEDNKSPSSKERKPVEADLDKSSEDEGANSSEDGDSHSSAEEEVKKKQEKPAQVYGKRVEHLKSIIKSCGMSIPPTVYRRAKQAPESKREAFLIKELEEILSKEGLSTNPSEKGCSCTALVYGAFQALRWGGCPGA